MKKKLLSKNLTAISLSVMMVFTPLTLHFVNKGVNLSINDIHAQDINFIGANISNSRIETYEERRNYYFFNKVQFTDLNTTYDEEVKAVAEVPIETKVLKLNFDTIVRSHQNKKHVHVVEASSNVSVVTSVMIEQYSTKTSKSLIVNLNPLKYDNVYKVTLDKEIAENNTIEKLLYGPKLAKEKVFYFKTETAVAKVDLDESSVYPGGKADIEITLLNGENAPLPFRNLNIEVFTMDQLRLLGTNNQAKNFRTDENGKVRFSVIVPENAPIGENLKINIAEIKNDTIVPIISKPIFTASVNLDENKLIQGSNIDAELSVNLNDIIASNKKVHLEVLSPDNNKLVDTDFVTNHYGKFNVNIQIPDDASLVGKNLSFILNGKGINTQYIIKAKPISVASSSGSSSSSSRESYRIRDNKNYYIDFKGARGITLYNSKDVISDTVATDIKKIVLKFDKNVNFKNKKNTLEENRNKIKITDENENPVDITIDLSNEENHKNYLDIAINKNLKQNSIYKLTIDKNLISNDGDILGKDVVMYFKTSNATNNTDVTSSSNNTQIKMQDKEVSEIISNFNDVKADSWYAKSIAFVVKNKIFEGTGYGKFEPQSKMSRAMFVMVLSKLSKEDIIPSNTKFSDVPSGKWYTNSVAWATDKKIVSGNSNNNFNPNKSISREQLIVMLYNYYKLNNKSSNISENLSNYYDYTDVSPWAKEAMTWATSKGIISGNNGNILPKNYATRAEVAIIIQKYMELAK